MRKKSNLDDLINVEVREREKEREKERKRACGVAN